MTEVEQLLRDTFAAHEAQAPTGGDLAHAAQARARSRSRRWATPLVGATVAVAIVVAVWAVSARLVGSNGTTSDQPASQPPVTVPAMVLQAAEALRAQPGVHVTEPVQWSRVEYGQYIRLVTHGQLSTEQPVDASEVYVIQFRGTFPFPGTRSQGALGQMPPESYPVQDQVICATAGCPFRSGGPMFEKPGSLKFATATLQPGVIDLLKPIDLSRIATVRTFVLHAK